MFLTNNLCNKHSKNNYPFHTYRLRNAHLIGLQEQRDKTPPLHSVDIYI